jgi:hypothetical protein
MGRTIRGDYVKSQANGGWVKTRSNGVRALRLYGAVQRQIAPAQGVEAPVDGDQGFS